MKELIKHGRINDLLRDDIIYHSKGSEPILLDRDYVSTTSIKDTYFKDFTVSNSSLPNSQKGYASSSVSMPAYLTNQVPKSKQFYEDLKELSKNPAYIR